MYQKSASDARLSTIVVHGPEPLSILLFSRQWLRLWVLLHLFSINDFHCWVVRGIWQCKVSLDCCQNALQYRHDPFSILNKIKCFILPLRPSMTLPKNSFSWHGSDQTLSLYLTAEKFEIFSLTCKRTQFSLTISIYIWSSGSSFIQLKNSWKHWCEILQQVDFDPDFFQCCSIFFTSLTIARIFRCSFFSFALLLLRYKWKSLNILTNDPFSPLTSFTFFPTSETLMTNIEGIFRSRRTPPALCPAGYLQLTVMEKASYFGNPPERLKSRLPPPSFSLYLLTGTGRTHYLACNCVPLSQEMNLFEACCLHPFLKYLFMPFCRALSFMQSIY